jgi:hypothetical protein
MRFGSNPFQARIVSNFAGRIRAIEILAAGTGIITRI